MKLETVGIRPSMNAFMCRLCIQMLGSHRLNEKVPPALMKITSIAIEFTSNDHVKARALAADTPARKPSK
jgi:hypothetical protein